MSAALIFEMPSFDLAIFLTHLVLIATKLLSYFNVLGSIFSRSISYTPSSSLALLRLLRKHIYTTYLRSIEDNRDILSDSFFFSEAVILLKLLKLECYIRSVVLTASLLLVLGIWKSFNLLRRSVNFFWIWLKTTFF